MLTKQDLQAIKEIVSGSIDERVPAIIDERVPKIINQLVPGIVSSMIDQRVPEVIDQRVPTIIDQKLKPIKSDLRKIKKDVSVLIARTDREDIRLQKRVEILERHTGLVTN